MMEFYSERMRIAAKPHKCDACGGIIRPGERYSAQAGKYEGEFFSRCWHEDCNNAIGYYIDFLSVEYELDYDEVSDALAENLCRMCKYFDFDEGDCSFYGGNCYPWRCPILQEMIRKKYEEKRKETR